MGASTAPGMRQELDANNCTETRNFALKSGSEIKIDVGIAAK